MLHLFYQGVWSTLLYSVLLSPLPGHTGNAGCIGQVRALSPEIVPYNYYSVCLAIQVQLTTGQKKRRTDTDTSIQTEKHKEWRTEKDIQKDWKKDWKERETNTTRKTERLTGRLWDKWGDREQIAEAIKTTRQTRETERQTQSNQMERQKTWRNRKTKEDRTRKTKRLTGGLWDKWGKREQIAEAIKTTRQKRETERQTQSNQIERQKK